MNLTEQPILAADRGPADAEAYARQLAVEIERTGVEPVSASVSLDVSLEVRFEDGTGVLFSTLFSGRPGYGPRTTARVLHLLGFGPVEFKDLRRQVTTSGDDLLIFNRTPHPVDAV